MPHARFTVEKMRSRRSVLKVGIAASAAGVLGRQSTASGADREGSPNISGKDLAVGSKSITLERKDHVALIGLNRPGKANRIDPEAYELLSEAYFEFEHDDSLRVAVLFGHGEHFSRGIDVEAFASTISSGGEQGLGQQRIDPFGKSPQRLSKPVVAVAHGDTWNIGHELCLAADVRVAAANANFGQTEASQARMPGSGATIRFVRDAGWGNAMRYMLTGDHWGAEDAKRMGLFQEIAADPEEALRLGILLATKIAACAPLSVRATLKSAHLAVDEAADRSLLLLGEQRRALYQTRDFEEGLAATREKRAPRYEGR
ncbi:crotonase/enoyl-CoA hydratase family protein [Bradyrhizobium sp. Ai1a-2]|uniref:crotonase/enoyl-CoA hydratase family protein n=1 Tax=Bradyrhizobium sp. Ai1a-2 TaxID=196490 RepID=UPI001FCC0899|nr:crotonase/enoyl-CoA hydratase family protein [Bradyrhizobium sp. Ai1a-2]